VQSILAEENRARRSHSGARLKFSDAKLQKNNFTTENY